MNVLSTKLIPAFLLVSMAFLPSCSPEIVLAKSLLGDWEVSSYTVDGEEWMSVFISTFDMEFEEYDGDEGDFDFTIVYSSGETESFTGEYSLNSDADEIDLSYSDGTTEMWDITLEGDELELDANVDGFRVIITADRD